MNEHLTEVIIGQGLTFAAGLITAWVKLQGELVKLRSRVHVLEQSESKIQETLETLVTGINDLKILLARRGIND